VAGTRSYALPADVMDIERMAHKGIRLKRTSKFELDSLLNSDWTVNNGTPNHFYVDLDPNNQKYYLYPNPQGADAGANLDIEYVKIPPALSSDSSVPFGGHTLLAPYNDSLAYWAAKELLAINPDQAAIVKINLYNKHYQDDVNSCIEMFKNLEQSSLWRFVGGRYFKEWR